MSAKTTALKGYMEQRGRLLERLEPCRHRLLPVGGSRLLQNKDGEFKEVITQDRQTILGEIDKIDRYVMMILFPEKIIMGSARVLVDYGDGKVFGVDEGETGSE